VRAARRPIAVGLFIIFNPRCLGSGRSWGRRNCSHSNWGGASGIEDSEPQRARSYDDDNYLDSVSVFGGIEKNIVTKDFKGGEVTTFFCGSSINLSQADIKDKAVLELTQVFGGAQLIIPANWKLSSEVVSVFGAIEDKRILQKDQSTEPGKTLILRGTSVFGGIEIKSF
jgi:hypothetical protein